MAGLGPAIHAEPFATKKKAWILGPSPRMTATWTKRKTRVDGGSSKFNDGPGPYGAAWPSTSPARAQIFFFTK